VAFSAVLCASVDVDAEDGDADGNITTANVVGC